MAAEPSASMKDSMLNAALEPAENMLADGLDGDGLSSGEMLMECVVKVQKEFLCTCTPLSSHCIGASLCNFVVPLTVCVCVCVSVVDLLCTLGAQLLLAMAAQTAIQQHLKWLHCCWSADSDKCALRGSPYTGNVRA